MRLKKSELRRLIREEIERFIRQDRPLLEQGSIHARRHKWATRGNPPPPSDSNWSDFAAALDIGVLDLGEIGYEFGYDNFHDLDQSISPSRLADRDPQLFVRAARLHSLAAQGMEDGAILAAASGFGGTHRDEL